MCVIIIQPEGKYLSKDEAEAAWKTNPDGGGYAFINEDNQIETFKAMNFNAFWGHFERDRSENRDKDFLIHMRIATHGSVCIDNVHPFQVDEHTVMAHNGIIHGVPSTDPDGLDRSDTRLFIDLVLPDLPENWLDNPYISDMVQDWVGWSRIVFLTTNPVLDYSIYVLNSKRGDWVNGLWYSNTNHHPKKAWESQPLKKTDKQYYEGANGDLININGVYMSRASYEGWWNDAEAADPEPKALLPGQDLTKDAIEELRLTQYGMSWPIEAEGEDLICVGCESAVLEANDYECECYNIACESCYHLAEFCGCDSTWRRLTYVKDFSDNDQDHIADIAAIDTNDFNYNRKEDSSMTST